MIFGTTFSHRYARYLNLNLTDSLDEILKLKFNIIRLCAYWDEIQSTPNEFNFFDIKAILDKCQQNNQDVIFTLGMKSPRWPEFYFPSWLKIKNPTYAINHVLPFIKQSIIKLKNYNCIKYWQIENEPLDPSGHDKMVIPFDALKQEVDLARNLDPERKIIINLWGNELTKRNILPYVRLLADVIGLDIYYRVPCAIFKYRGPKDNDQTLSNIINESTKPIWITELQAEPWGNNMNMDSQLLLNYFRRAVKLNSQAILFWGIEYLLSEKNKGNYSLWNEVLNILHTKNFS